MPLRLALSLHAPDDALRSQIMPVNDRHPIADVLAACDAYYARRRRQVFIEYVMLDGVNDYYEHAVALAGSLIPAPLQGQPDPLQPDPLGSSRYGAIDAFRAALEEHGLRATVRPTRGRRLDAACGQLARRHRRRRVAPALTGTGPTRSWDPRRVEDESGGEASGPHLCCRQPVETRPARRPSSRWSAVLLAMIVAAWSPWVSTRRAPTGRRADPLSPRASRAGKPTASRR